MLDIILKVRNIEIKNEKIKMKEMKEMKNQKLKIKNGKFKIQLICTKQQQTLMRPEKNVEKKLYKRLERCTRYPKILGKLYNSEIRTQKVRKQKLTSPSRDRPELLSPWGRVGETQAEPEFPRRGVKAEYSDKAIYYQQPTPFISLF